MSNAVLRTRMFVPRPAMPGGLPAAKVPIAF